MRFMPIIISLVALLLISNVLINNAFASKQNMTPREVEEQENLNEVIDFAEDVMVKSRDQSDDRFIKCLKSFGHTIFCGCIRDELPVYQSIDSYFFIITTDKDELNYAELSGDDKALIDNTHKTRDKCVKKAF